MSDIPTIDPAMLTDDGRVSELSQVISWAGPAPDVAAAIQTAARRAVADALAEDRDGWSQPTPCLTCAAHLARAQAAESTVISLLDILKAKP